MSAGEPIELISSWRTGQRCPLRVGDKPKRRAWPRKIADVDTVLVHATAEAGGFGPGKSRLARKVAEVLGDETREPTPDELIEARRRALVERYGRQTYHGLYSPTVRTSLVQWPATDYTYHGDRANSCSLGWAYDGRFAPDHSDELDIEGGRESLRHLIRDALEQGCPLRRVSPHANHSRKPHDPGPLVWLEVVRPVAEQFGLELELDWTTGKGQPWARRWMDGSG